jgi:hypothetical protein
LDDADGLGGVDAEADDDGCVFGRGAAGPFASVLAGCGHERAGRAAGLDQSRLLQFPVGPADRVDRQAEVATV